MPKQEWPLEMGREAALAAAERVAGEDEVEAAAKRIVASRNLPAGCEINWEQFKADARAALALPPGKTHPTLEAKEHAREPERSLDEFLEYTKPVTEAEIEMQARTTSTPDEQGG